MDKMDLLPGQKWDREIRKAIKTSKFMIIFFSKNSVGKRGYIQREFKMALDVMEEMPDGQTFTIPVRLDDCQVPESFHHIHYTDLFEEGNFDKIVNVIEYVEDDITGVTSFSSDQAGNKEAEEHFAACAKENGALDEDIESFIEDGYFEQGNYQLFLIHSDTEEEKKI